MHCFCLVDIKLRSFSRQHALQWLIALEDTFRSSLQIYFLEVLVLSMTFISCNADDERRESAAHFCGDPGKVEGPCPGVSTKTGPGHPRHDGAKFL